MKPITRIKRMIRKQLNSKETFEISQYAKELAYEKKNTEHLTAIKNIGIGNKVLISGSTTETARLGIAASVGTVLSYGSKRVKVQITDCSRPGAWRLPYRLLKVPTEKNIKDAQKMAKHSRVAVGVVNQLNKVVGKVLQG